MAIGYDNSLIDDYQERAADKMNEAEELAARGEHREAIYRMTDAVGLLSEAIGELKHRG